MRWLLASSLVFALSSAAWARSEKTVAYPRDAVWPAAVRFLVVDERLKVTDKDADAGYVLFELRDDGKTFRGALEVMTVVVDGRTLVRFVLKLEDRPSWLESAMLTRLERKLRVELGSPTPPPSRPGPAPKDPPKVAPSEPPKDPPKPTPPSSIEDSPPPVSPTP